MTDGTIRAAILALSAVGGLAVVCIGILIAVLRTPDVAALAVLASIASAAVGGVAGTINSSRAQPQDQGRVDGRPRQDQPQEEQRRVADRSRSPSGS